MTLAVEGTHLPFATIVEIADTSPRTVGVHLACNHLRLFISIKPPHQQTEPSTDVELADGSPVQEDADVETPSGDGVV